MILAGNSRLTASDSQDPEKTPEKCPYCVTGAQKKTGLTKQEKTTDIWFDEKDLLIHICAHNTALKKRLLAYSRHYPESRQRSGEKE